MLNHINEWRKTKKTSVGFFKNRRRYFVCFHSVNFSKAFCYMILKGIYASKGNSPKGYVH